jgi:hypothetical protein
VTTGISKNCSELVCDDLATLLKNITKMPSHGTEQYKDADAVGIFVRMLSYSEGKEQCQPLFVSMSENAIRL